MPGVEYLPDQPGAAEPEEVLDSGGRRRLPRWVVPLGVIVVLAAAAGITIARNNSGGPPPPAAAPPSGAPLTLQPAPQPAPQPVPVGLGTRGRFGHPIHVGGPALDVATAGNEAWVLLGHEIVRIVRDRVELRAAIPGPAAVAGPDSAARLVLDVPGGVIWFVAQGAPHGRLLEYDMVHLRLLRQLTVGPIDGAAALDGHLYLTSGSRLVDVAPGRAPTTVGTVAATLGQIVADPARHRLLMTDYAASSSIWPITLAKNGRARIGKPGVVHATKVSLGVAEGLIWAAGYTSTHALLSRLDPATLRPVAASPIGRSLGPGAVIVASGVVVIWERDGDSSQLRCIDAATGHQLQTWMIDGPVTSGGTKAFVATAGGIVPLQQSACSG
jgi:hypothetical protein